MQAVLVAVRHLSQLSDLRFVQALLLPVASFEPPLHFVVKMVLEQPFWVLAQALPWVEVLVPLVVGVLAQVLVWVGARVLLWVEAQALLSVEALEQVSVWVEVSPLLSVGGQVAISV